MLEVVDLHKSYHGRKILNGISFCLPAGFALGVSGANGSGKSTLLRLLAQVQQPDRGQIRWQGRSVMGDRRFLRENVGYVPQNSDLLPELTAEQQLHLWQSACGRSGKLPGALVELMGLEELRKIRTAELSGGMQRRVSIAMALLAEPKILIMDEVTAGLDEAYTGRLLDWLEQYLEAGGTMVWCSHRQQELERLCGSCLHLENGATTLI